MGLATPYLTLAIGRQNVTGGAIVPANSWQDGCTIVRSALGVFDGTLDQAASATQPGTAQFAQAETEGGAARQATITRPSATTFRVETFDSTGAPADASFSFEIRVAPTTND